LGKIRFSETSIWTLQEFRNRGISPSARTVTGGLKKIAPLFTAIFEAIRERNQREHQQMKHVGWFLCRLKEKNLINGIFGFLDQKQRLFFM